MRCSMTGQPLRDTSDGIYDDGEWISWDWINGHIADQELRGDLGAGQRGQRLDVDHALNDALAEREHLVEVAERDERVGGELRGEFPNANLEVVKIFQELVALADAYKRETGRYLQIWGELGELYAEIKFGVVRHQPGTQGSDGRIGNDWVEVKTISPEKLNEVIQVKRAGNFNKLLVVKISEDFEFDARLIDRKLLRKGKGKHAKLRWGEHQDPAAKDTAP